MDQIISALIRPAVWHTVYQFSQVWATKAGRCFIDCIKLIYGLFTLQQHSDYSGINFNTLTILLIWLSPALMHFLHKNNSGRVQFIYFVVKAIISSVVISLYSKYGDSKVSEHWVNSRVQSWTQPGLKSFSLLTLKCVSLHCFDMSTV